ncbi:hypothetical protein ABIF90_001675 [Bradyrhizobium japonicum]
MSSQLASKSEKPVLLASQNPTPFLFNSYLGGNPFADTIEFNDTDVEVLPRAVSLDSRARDSRLVTGEHVSCVSVILIRKTIIRFRVLKFMGRLAQILKRSRQLSPHGKRGRRNGIVDKRVKVGARERACTQDPKFFKDISNVGFQTCPFHKTNAEIRCCAKSGQFFLNAILLTAPRCQSHLACHIPGRNYNSNSGTESPYEREPVCADRQHDKPHRKDHGEQQKRKSKKIILLSHTPNLPWPVSFVERVAG